MLVTKHHDGTEPLTYRNEEIGNLSLVFEPMFAVFVAATVDVSRGAVSNHTAKEDGVEPREWAPVFKLVVWLESARDHGDCLLESSNQTPGDGEPYISGVVDLACKTVPAIDEDRALRSLNGLGVVDSLPWNLGEGLAGNHLSALHGTETVLLAVAAVPDPVPEEVGNVHGGKEPTVPAVLRWIVVSEVDGAVAVGERNASEVPEDEHETPLLVVHVPGSDDELLALGAGIGVEVVSHDEEHDFTGDVAVALPLTSRRTQAENEQKVPRHADLAEHLEVQDAEHAGVQLGAHEEVVDGVAGHAVLLSAVEGREVRDKTDQETAQDGNRQERTEFVNGIVQWPDAGEVQNSQDSKCRIQGDECVAKVLELLASFMRKRLTPAPDTREQAVASTLKDEIGPIPEPGLGVRKSASVHVVDELGSKGTPTLTRSP